MEKYWDYCLDSHQAQTTKASNCLHCSLFFWRSVETFSPQMFSYREGDERFTAKLRCFVSMWSQKLGQQLPEDMMDLWYCLAAWLLWFECMMDWGTNEGKVSYEERPISGTLKESSGILTWVKFVDNLDLNDLLQIASFAGPANSALCLQSFMNIFCFWIPSEQFASWIRPSGRADSRAMMSSSWCN